MGELLVQQAQQIIEGVLVAAVGRGGEHHKVPARLLRQTLQQGVALVTPPPFARRAGVGLVHDHEIAAGAQKAFTVAFALDPVQAHHRERKGLEDRAAHRQSPLQPRRRTWPHHFSRKMELSGHVLAPLLAQVRRADHRHLADLATVQQLPGDQQCLHGFAQTHLVGDQHPRHLLLEGHQQRHQLVGAGLQGDVAEAAKRPGTGPELEHQGIAQQQGRTLGTALGRIRWLELGRAHIAALQGPVERGDLAVAAAQRAQLQYLGCFFSLTLGKGNPLTPSDIHD